MDSRTDWKKIIQMVAVIGVLCLFVGIATRIYQKNQTSLDTYAKKNPEIAYAKQEPEQELEPEPEAEEAELTKSDAENAAENEGLTAQDIYDNFYYTVEDEGYKFHIMYYNSKHEISTAELGGSVEDAAETLEYFYDLFKAEHEFGSIGELQGFLDKFAPGDF
ncbi:MAG: hypothetical protein IJ796_06040 [Lachnospiraceae bacterium]|nr:hypothetical protein [Lachnospiraceae bacterium]